MMHNVGPEPTGHTTDNTTEVLVAASEVVHSLSPKARQRLAKGAYFVRVPAYDAKRLIAAVEALEAHDA